MTPFTLAWSGHTVHVEPGPAADTPLGIQTLRPTSDTVWWVRIGEACWCTMEPVAQDDCSPEEAVRLWLAMHRGRVGRGISSETQSEETA